MNEISKESILILDEDRGITELCVRALNEAGYHALGVNFPDEGIEILERQPIDVLMVAARMTGMDSRQFIEIAWQQQPGLAVVLMTGLGDIETAINYLLNRVDGILIKHFSEEELVECVQQALLHRRQKLVSMRLQALEPLLKILKNIFEVQSLDELAELVLQAMKTFLGCENAAIFLRREGMKGVFEISHGYGKVPPLSKIYKIYKPGFANVIDQSLCVGADVLEQYSLTSLLWIPIYDSEDHLGVVVAGRNKKGHDFSNIDLEVASIFIGHIAGAIRNLKEQIEIRAQRQQIEEAQELLAHIQASRPLESLMTTVAHEVNNPLQAIQSNLELVERATSPENRAYYLAVVKQELSRLREVVANMLDLYRPGQKSKTSFSINAALQQVLNLYAPKLSEQDISVHTNFAEDLPEVWGLQARMEQVFVNLIINALEAMPEGGKLFASTELQKNGISIIIKDTGHGILPENKNRVFKPFFTTKEDGHGLGLTICDNIISTEHQGKIELQANNGEGACFVMTLPFGG